MADSADSIHDVAAKPAGAGLAAFLDRAIATVLEAVTAVLVVAEIVILFVGILARYVFHRPLVWSDDNDYQVAYDATKSSRSEAFEAWRNEVEHARRIEREAESLDVTGYQPRWSEHVSLRLVMHHLCHEYARHNGHADFLREGIDGVTGA